MRNRVLTEIGIAQRIRLAATVLLRGRQSRYFEDEHIEFNLEDLAGVRDPDVRACRLNVLTPTLSAAEAFGGLATQISLALQVFSHSLSKKGWHIRFISIGNEPARGDNIVTHYMQRLGIEPSDVTFHYVPRDSAAIPVSEGDLFFGSLWFSMLWAMPLMRFQHLSLGQPKRPYISLVQDYEAGFYPWSSAYVLCTSCYDSEWPKRIVFNSAELASFYKAQGHTFEEAVTYEPVLNPSLAEFLLKRPPPAKERRILVYGRPNSRRNCFYLVKKSLQIWSSKYDNASQWRVVSVGDSYEPFSLNGGAEIEVLGKLSLAEYAENLHRAAVGLSLMASPHPSYPPLEMAHFGALTVCNDFPHKEMASWHENMMPVSALDAERIAAQLIDACARFDKDPRIGLAGKTLKPFYVNDPDPTVLEDIAGMIVRGLQ